MRIVIALILGFLWFFVASVSDEILTTPGHRQIAAGTFAITTSYLAICAFLVARKGAAFRSNFVIMAVLAAPLTAMTLLMLMVETWKTILDQIPFLPLGYFGIVAGALGASAWGTSNRFAVPSGHPK